MPSRIIDIPEDDIFKYDRLDREPAIAAHTKLLRAKSPQVIAIDAPWGSGKSNFMALWAAYMDQHNIPVIRFNAWQSSLSEPLYAMTGKILKRFEEIPNARIGPFHRRLVKYVRKASRHSQSNVKLAASLMPEIQPAIPVISAFWKMLQPARTALMKTQFMRSIFPAPIDSIDAFRQAMSDYAGHWDNPPIIVMIDELDRCSPPYAVQMLQTLEHIFYVDNVNFVLAINQAQLVHSVKHFYGDEFDAHKYIERFFDHVLPLPLSSRPNYIETLVSDLPLDILITGYLNASDLNLREVDRAISLLREILDERDSTIDVKALIYLWIIRTIAPDDYRLYRSGQITDKDLIDSIFLQDRYSRFRADTNDALNSFTINMEAALMALTRATIRQSNLDALLSVMEPELHDYHDRNRRGNVIATPDVSTEYSYAVLDAGRFATPVAQSSLLIDRTALLNAANRLDRSRLPIADSPDKA
ncbi:MAG: hypothetical protein F4Z35_06455 [Dehalococcoidia bacterium]|nr:hypothetical protein [Dehalococcoidia bacterium]